MITETILTVVTDKDDYDFAVYADVRSRDPKKPEFEHVPVYLKFKTVEIQPSDKK